MHVKACTQENTRIYGTSNSRKSCLKSFEKSTVLKIPFNMYIINVFILYSVSGHRSENVKYR